MPFYHELSGGAFTLFLIFALSMAGFIIYHYLSHYQGSKSIYLMRRLPDRWELHHRCLTLPLTGALIYLGCALFLLLVYFCIYLIVTPAQCLIPGQWPLLLHRIL